jgi:hypothetical protein
MLQPVYDIAAHSCSCFGYVAFEWFGKMCLWFVWTLANWCLADQPLSTLIILFGTSYANQDLMLL